MQARTAIVTDRRSELCESDLNKNFEDIPGGFPPATCDPFAIKMLIKEELACRLVAVVIVIKILIVDL